MTTEILNDKINFFTDLAIDSNELMKKYDISLITEDNKSFNYDIFPNEIGLEDLMVKSSLYEYNKNIYQCHLYKINIRRTSDLNCDFNSLQEIKKLILLNEMIPILKKQFTHIYKIIEIRHNFIIFGYVNNYIEYICYGNKI